MPNVEVRHGQMLVPYPLADALGLERRDRLMLEPGGVVSRFGWLRGMSRRLTHRPFEVVDCGETTTGWNGASPLPDGTYRVEGSAPRFLLVRYETGCGFQSQFW
jgi:hypothetical protein